jgi:sarcosine oxidase subunit alpha
VTSWTWSPSLGRHVGLALVTEGRTRIGQAMFLDAPTVGRTVRVTLAEPSFYDPGGEKLRA